MKTNLFILILLAFALSGHCQPPEGKATPGSVYGAKTDNKDAVEASALPALLSKKDTVQVKVRATVLEVCTKKGCWFTFKVDDKQDAFVKMKDYAFFVPVDLVGKTVILDGAAFIKTTSVDELKHYAEDGKKSQAEIDAIKEPKKEIRFLANGILVEK